jgi:carboxyl-terminal processing protease
VDVVGWRLDDVVELIRGPKNTMIRLKLIPASAPDEQQTKIIKLARGTVRLEDQAASKDVIEVRRNGTVYTIGVIRIPTFYLDIKAMQSSVNNYKSTTRDVKRILAELSARKVDGVVIDLRDNGGGLLHEANTLTGSSSKAGPPYRSVRGRRDRNPVRPRSDHRLQRAPGRHDQPPERVRVRDLCGAIQDYGRGIIIGENSFGKGTVQTLLSLSRGQIKVTTSKFYRISGESTQHRGIIPDLHYPSLYDRKGIGESTLKDALPWMPSGRCPTSDTATFPRTRGSSSLSTPPASGMTRTTSTHWP